MNGELLEYRDRPPLDEGLGKSFVRKWPERWSGGAALGLDLRVAPQPLGPEAWRRLGGKAPGRGRSQLHSETRKAEAAAPLHRGLRSCCCLALGRLSHGPSRPGLARTRARRPEAAATRALEPLHLTFFSGTKPFAVAVATGSLANTNFTFYPPPFLAHSLLILGSVRWPYRSGLEGAGSLATDCPPLGAGRPAASEAGAASAVSMVTAQTASPPRGEDEACLARRLAPGLMAGPGPLRRKVPATGLRGSVHQVRAGLLGAEEVGCRSTPATSPPLPVPCIPEHTRTKYRREASPVATAPEFFLVCFCFFSWQTAGERDCQQRMERLREAFSEFYPNWESTFQQLDSLTGFPSFSVKSHSLAGDTDGLKWERCYIVVPKEGNINVFLFVKHASCKKFPQRIPIMLVFPELGSAGILTWYLST